MPRLSRFSLTTTHEDNAMTMATLSKGSSTAGKQPTTTTRRKLSLYSLSTLFSKPFFRGKIARSRDPSPAPPSPLPSGNLAVPMSRVRSRSAPFSEMSPIEETQKETLSDSESSPLDTEIQKLLNASPECTMVNIVHCYRDAEEEEDDAEEPEVICFVGSSDDGSYCSSVSRSGSGSPICVDVGGDDVIVVTQSSCNSLDVIDLTHLPSPCPSPRSPHRCVVAPSSNEVSNAQRMLSLTQSPTAVHFHPSAAASAAAAAAAAAATAASSLPSRPSPCPRSSESEISLTPNASSLSDSMGSSGGGTVAARSAGHRHGIAPPSASTTYAPLSDTTNLEVLEYPFLTMKTYPPGFIVHIGGTVSARSVKLLDRINNSEEPETRDNWWTELRMEVRSHARALGCTVILGYEEHTSICEEVCVLSAAGTAAIVKLQSSEMDSSMISNKDVDFKRDNLKSDGHHRLSSSHPHAEESKAALCRMCHIPYSKSNIPFPIKLSRCAVCRKGKVPDVLIGTIEPPAGMGVTGHGCLIQARLCRPKRDESRGDQQAKEVSDGLPFLEYELHRQLIHKLRIKGMNAIFGLKVQVSVGEKHMVGLATGTAVFLSALPAPTLPMLGTTNITSKQTKRSRIQKMLAEAHTASLDHYGLKAHTNKVSGDVDATKWTDSEDSEEELNELDLSAGNKDTCIIEIDDAEEVDVLELLIDPQPPEGFEAVTTEAVPGLPEPIQRRHLQAFNRVWKGKIPSSQPTRHFNRYFEMIMRSIYFKLRKAQPCVITNLQFSVDLPEDDEIQINVFGTAVVGFSKCLGDPTSNLRNLIKGSSENEMIFHLEDDNHHNHINEHVAGTPAVNSIAASHRMAKNLLERSKLFVQKERQLVDITTLIRLPGSRVERYLGHLNFFFIRESTCIREDGGLSGFMQSFITEVLAIVRAHVSALGGNAMVAYFMTQCVLLHNPHKNQGQCLINVGGDVVQAVRCPDNKDI